MILSAAEHYGYVALPNRVGCKNHVKCVVSVKGVAGRLLQQVTSLLVLCLLLASIRCLRSLSICCANPTCCNWSMQSCLPAATRACSSLALGSSWPSSQRLDQSSGMSTDSCVLGVAALCAQSGWHAANSHCARMDVQRQHACKLQCKHVMVLACCCPQQQQPCCATNSA